VKINTTQTEIKMEKCGINKHFGKFKSYFEDVSDLKSRYCVPKGNNLTLTGFYGDFERGNGFIMVYTNKCTNGTKINDYRIDCFDKDYINGYMEGTFLQMSYIL
jgi:hypothetical protein